MANIFELLDQASQIPDTPQVTPEQLAQMPAPNFDLIVAGRAENLEVIRQVSLSMILERFPIRH